MKSSVTALIDACSLAGALKRQVLLHLAEAGFYRPLWSPDILREMAAVVTALVSEGLQPNPDPVGHVARLIAAMSSAFEDALVTGYEPCLPRASGLPDPGDRHVLAAAIRAAADVIVTDNLRDFPPSALAPFGLVAKSTDAFLTDLVALDAEWAAVTLQRMRVSFRRPELTALELLMLMETRGLSQTARLLRPCLRLL